MINEAVRVTRSTPLILAAFFALSSPAHWMSVAGIVLLVIGLLTAKNDIAQARDRIVAFTNLCFAIPLAVFGAEYLSERFFRLLAPRPHLHPGAHYEK